MHAHRKQAPLVQLSADPSAPTAVFVLTSERVDRDNEIVNPAGGDFADYALNPGVLALHRTGQGFPLATLAGDPPPGHAPVERGLAVWQDWIGDGTAYPLGGARRRALLGQLRFDLEDDDSRQAWRKVERGLLRACSISFLPVGAPRRHAEGGAVYDRWKLLEVSLVDVPSNADAVRVKGAGAADDLLDGEEGEVRRERLREVLALLREYLRTSTSMTDGDKLRLAEAVSKLSSLVGPDPDAVAESKSARVAALKKSYAAADQVLLDNPDLGENYKQIIKRFADRRRDEDLTEEERAQVEQAVAELKAAEASLLHAVYVHTGKQFGELTGQSNGDGRGR